MAYCTVAQVASMFKNVEFGAKSLITEAEVTEFIEESDELIDAYVAQQYTVPIVSGTSPKAFKLMRRLSRMLTAHRVQGILETKNQTPELSQDTQGRSLEDLAMGVLKQIAAAKVSLSDATPQSSGGGISSYNVDNEIEFTFKVDTDQW